MKQLSKNIYLTQILLCTTLIDTYAVTKEKPRFPNILFCIADDASFYHFGKMGCKWINTPNFDRLANEGVFFQNCYTPNAKSAPSRACILTGRYSWMLHEGGNHSGNFPPEFKVFTETLGDNGYKVAYTGKGWAPGNPGQKDGKLRLLTGYGYQDKKMEPPTSCISINDYAANFADFLEDAQKEGKPWFFWLGFEEPHRAYEYGTGVSVGKKRLSDIDKVPEFWPDVTVVRHDMLDYALEIEWLDYQLGKVLQKLEASGEMEHTIIIFTSDNGMPFPRSKGNNYELSHHMPLAIMWKGGIKKSGRIVEDFISFVDFAPTFLDLINVPVEKSGMDSFGGKSFKDILLSDKSGVIDKKRNYAIFGRERNDYGRPGNQGYPIRGIMRDGMLYLRNIKSYLYPAGNPETGYMDTDGSPTKTVILDMNRKGDSSYFYQLCMGLRSTDELYDIEKDKYCMHNLVNNPNYKKIKESMRDELFCILESQNDPRFVGDDPNIFDRYPYDKQNIKWNFYERFINGEIVEPWNFTWWINPTDYER